METIKIISAEEVAMLREQIKALEKQYRNVKIAGLSYCEEILRQANRPMTAEEISEATGLSEAEIHANLVPLTSCHREANLRLNIRCGKQYKTATYVKLDEYGNPDYNEKILVRKEKRVYFLR